MINHEAHLKQVLEAQKQLAQEINELNGILTNKKEIFTKHQGIIEYLTSNGVKLEEENSNTQPQPEIEE